MTTMKRLNRSKEYREGFVASQIDVSIPFQIRGLRKKREMDQRELAELTGMAQPRISAIESPGYSSFTIDTLKRVAAAFDVALIVRFGAFSELAKQSTNFSPDDFQVPSFDEEFALAAPTDMKTTAKNVVIVGKPEFKYLTYDTPRWAPNNERHQQIVNPIKPTFQVAASTQNIAGGQYGN